MVMANATTFLAYLVACFTLFYLARRTRRVVPRDWAYFATGFAFVLVACGTTHLMEVVTTWSALFWVDAWVNVLTAVLSAWIAVQFIRRAKTIAFGINDYADRLASTQDENAHMAESLMAAQKLEEWSRMSAVVTHEIGNPLEAIQNILYLIRQSEVATPEIVRLTRTASEEADRILAISRSTLAFFRQSTTPERVDLRAAAESVRFLLDPILRRTEVTLDVHVSGDVAIQAFAGEARQLLLNLVRNACEATPRGGGRVTVSFTGHAEDVEIVVTDEGSGIAPEVLPTLFHFGVTTKGSQGNGIGLWSVKHIVDKHGGTIRLDTSSGQGTRFTILWPRRFADAPVSIAPTPGRLTPATV
jgi:signal transduction histidine kinase